jgi:serine/threonine protein phosphatase PrpC
VSPEPEVNEIILCPNDQFFLIATDGLWDVMDSQVHKFLDDEI